MKSPARRRRITATMLIATIPLGIFIWSLANYQPQTTNPVSPKGVEGSSEGSAIMELKKLEVRPKESASKYERAEFGSGWSTWGDCDTRQKILARDLEEVEFSANGCTVMTGLLNDPYTGKRIDFVRGTSTSSAVQIDHVVALSNAWNTGASYWDKSQRIKLANDDLELLAVDGPANQQKSNADASDWLPSNVAFHCQYVARQIAVKVKYALWVTSDEKIAMENVLETCPNQPLPTP